VVSCSSSCFTDLPKTSTRFCLVKSACIFPPPTIENSPAICGWVNPSNKPAKPRQGRQNIDRSNCPPSTRRPNASFPSPPGTNSWPIEFFQSRRDCGPKPNGWPVCGTTLGKRKNQSATSKRLRQSALLCRDTPPSRQTCRKAMDIENTPAIYGWVNPSNKPTKPRRGGRTSTQNTFHVVSYLSKIISS